MNWKIIPALAYIVFFNLAVSCIDDLFSSSASSSKEVKAALVCSCPVRIDSLGEEAVREVLLGEETFWSRNEEIILAVLRDSEARTLFPENDVEAHPR